MNIALSEPFPILESALKKAFSKKNLPFSVSVEKAVPHCLYDLFLTDRFYLPSFAKASVLLIPGGGKTKNGWNSGQILTGGMNRADPVTFSSIGEDRAFLCLQQEIFLCGTWIGPFEKPVFFNRQFSLYKNLASGFALALAEILAGEE